MSAEQHPDGPRAVLERLHAAMNRRDLEAFVACFAPDYASQQPAHPARLFRGSGQVRQNWAAMFSGIPDFRADLLRSAVAGEAVWAEWRWTGTQRDGTAVDIRGVTIFGVRDGHLAWGRLYVEPVEGDGGDIGRAVEELSGEAPHGR